MTCHLTATASTKVCGEERIPVGELHLCPVHDEAVIRQMVAASSE